MWSARLSLAFEQVGTRTVLARRRHEGPLVVQRAFHEPDGSCQIYVVHPPGGVVGGDTLALELTLQEQARTLVTTPAATKLYASPSATAVLTQQCRVADGAVLELLPQGTILYDGARAASTTRVLLGEAAQFVGWEVLSLGRDDRGFNAGQFVQRWQLERQGRLLWAERTALDGGSPLLSASWGLGGRRVLATMVGTGAERFALDELRASSERLSSNDDWFSATKLGEVLVCRYLGYSAETAKRLFSAAWAALRPAVSGRNAVQPRIWAT
jgi:urease accessory protein